MTAFDFTFIAVLAVIGGLIYPWAKEVISYKRDEAHTKAVEARVARLEAQAEEKVRLSSAEQKAVLEARRREELQEIIHKENMLRAQGRYLVVEQTLEKIKAGELNAIKALQ